MTAAEQRPLTPAQIETAACLPWYREWLISTCEHPAIAGGYEKPAYCTRCSWQDDHPMWAGAR